MTTKLDFSFIYFHNKTKHFEKNRKSFADWNSKSLNIFQFQSSYANIKNKQ